MTKISLSILMFIAIVFFGIFLFPKDKMDVHQHKKSVAVCKNETRNEDSLNLSLKCKTFVEHVKWQSTQDVTYDPSYFSMSYPNGDVPANKGVCVDVPIRGLRSIGIDLQQLVHEDILRAPQDYHLQRTDKNIDHRRCSNLLIYFKRKHQTVPPTLDERDYQPGDLVFWDIARGHVGVVSDVKVPGTNRFYIVHNICCGPQMEDVLFLAKIVCHVPFSSW